MKTHPEKRLTAAQFAVALQGLFFLGLVFSLCVQAGIHFKWTEKEFNAGFWLFWMIGIWGTLLLGPVGFIAFLFWVSRTGRSLRELGVSDLKFSTKWAVLWFLIPVINIFRPWQVMQEIWKASAPRKNGSLPFDRQEIPNSSYILFWWISIVLGFYGLVALRFPLGIDWMVASMVWLLVLIPGAGLQIGLIIMLQQRLYHLEAVMEPGGEPETETLSTN